MIRMSGDWPLCRLWWSHAHREWPESCSWQKISTYLSFCVDNCSPRLPVQLLIVLMTDVVGVPRLFVLAETMTDHCSHKFIESFIRPIPRLCATAWTWAATPCKSIVHLSRLGMNSAFRVGERWIVWRRTVMTIPAIADNILEANYIAEIL